MKVLLVHNEYQQPGGEDVVFRQEKQLLSRFGHTVLTYTRSNHEIAKFSGPRRLQLLRQLVWAEDARQDVARILMEEKPHIVHVHNTFTQISPSIYAACRDAGVPVVQTLHNFRLLCPAATFYRDGTTCQECLTHSLWHGVEHGCYRSSRIATAAVATMLSTHRWLRTWNDNVSRYIVLTEFARSQFVRGGLPRHLLVLKPNFVDPDPSPHLSTSNGEYALFAGRLSEEKGLQTLLDCWFHLKGSVPLRILGNGPLERELQAEVSRRDIQRVSLLGRLPHGEVVKALKGARFLVFPSRYYEGMPMVLIEAFACGVPVIASRLGAMEEIVKDGQTGLHFTSASAEDLAAKVAWAWEHPLQMEAMGIEARREYESKYTAEKNYLLLMDIYRKAIQQAPATGQRYGRELNRVAASNPEV